MNTFTIFRNAFGVAVLGVATLVGCSGASENAGENEEALKNGPVADPTDKPSPSPPPSCAYPSNQYSYVPVLTHLPPPFNECLSESRFPPRGFDPNNAFEMGLLANGCTPQVRGIGNAPPTPPGGDGWSYADCPDTCAVRALISTWHPHDPVGARTSKAPMSTCGAGISPPAAGRVYALWDPHCPSTCTTTNVY